MAIAPPHGFTRGSSFGDLEVVEEREHLDRERLVDLDQADVVHREPLPGQELLVAGTGPMPMTSGSTPANWKSTRRILAGRPSSLATSSAAMRQPVAPSLMPEECPR